MNEVQAICESFTALCLRLQPGWPPAVLNASTRLRCSLQSYASHRGHVTLWRMLKADVAEFEAALTHRP